MNTAQFRVVHAGPFVTFQDGGRPGNMRFGVSASGPMDRQSFTTANLAVGNQKTATAIEVSMGGLILECVSGAAVCAVIGGKFEIELDGAKHSSGAMLTVNAGQRLSIRPGESGSWCYLALAGNIDTPTWLGKSATHALSGFGGGMLKAGQKFTLFNAKVFTPRSPAIVPYKTQPFGGYVRGVLGPQDQHFTTDAKRLFLSAEFALTDAYDRMGVRLQGPALTINGSLSMPSEPVLKGSVQVAGDGVPTVLLADHQTTGGYPKIATVLACDLDEFVQLRPRQKFRFHAVQPEDAVVLARLAAIENRSYFDAVRHGE